MQNLFRITYMDVQELYWKKLITLNYSNSEDQSKGQQLYWNDLCVLGFCLDNLPEYTPIPGEILTGLITVSGLLTVLLLASYKTWRPHRTYHFLPALRIFDLNFNLKWFV